MSSLPIASTQTSAANSAASPASATISPEVAAQVKQALAPVAASAQKLTAALAQGQAKLSGLGQLKSAIADFQTLAQGLTGSGPSIATAPADASSKLQSFVAAYNTLNGKLQTLQKGDLKADPGLAQVSAQLSQLMRDAGAASGGGALAKAGISIDASGTMKLDSAKLASAVASDPNGVAALLLPNGRGIVDQLASRLGSLNTANGPLGREAATAGKQVAALESKQTALTKTLTTQANALAAFYTQQAKAGSGASPTSLFDMLA